MNSKTWPTGGIQELIRDRKGDRSYDQLAHESDYAVKSANIQRMATSTPSRFPDPATIRAIAKLMRCTEHEVVMACATSLGLSVGGASPDDLVIRGAGRYSSLSQKHILDAAAFAGYWETGGEEAAEVPAEPDWTQADFDQAADDQRELTQDQRWEQQHGGRGEESQLGPDED